MEELENRLNIQKRREKEEEKKRRRRERGKECNLIKKKTEMQLA